MKTTIMIFKRGLLFFLLGLPLIGGAQTNPDFIITKTQDTIYGKALISLKQLGRVKFQKGELGAIQTYSSNDILGFRRDGFYFKSCTVRSKGKNHTWFLLELVHGNASLYMAKEGKLYFLDKGGIYYPVEKIDDALQEGRLKEDKRYIGLLISVFSDCPKLKNEISTLRFTSRALIDITRKYNSCVDPEYSEAPKQAPVSLKYGGSVGITINKPLYFGSAPGGTPDDIGFGYTLGGEIQTRFAFSKILFFQGGIFLTKNKAATNIRGLFSNVYYEIIGVFIQPSFKLGIAYPSEVLSPYLSGGLIPSFPVYDKFTERVVRDNGPTTELELDRSLRGEVAFPICAGVQLNLYENIQPFVEYQYEYNADLFAIHKIMAGVRF